MPTDDLTAQPARIACPAPSPPADLGVLFVHGIGDQREGETLLAFGEPVLDYLQRTVTRADSSRLDYVRVEQATLLPSRRFDTRAPSATLEVRVPREGRTADGLLFSHLPLQRQRWKFVESWWGEQVLAPTPLALIGWLMTRGPWVALVHIVARSESRGRTIAGDPTGQSVVAWLAALLLFLAGLVLVWVPLTAVMQAGLLILAVLALIPVPRFGHLISGFLLRASGVLGDSYVLVQHETQRAAIVARVRDTLAALRKQCSKVAVVAHSQGTAVVYDAIRTGAPQPDLLLTFGSGLAKLEMLRVGERLSRASLTVTGWVVPLALTALAIWLRHSADADISAGRPEWVASLKALLAGSRDSTVRLAMLPAMLFTALATAGLVLGLLSIWEARRIVKAQRRDERHADVQLATRWIDVCATYDPVPNASLSESLERPEIEVETVINRSSFGSDHTSYFDNRAEFVPLVAHALCETTGLVAGSPDHAAIVREARAYHATSVHLLAWTRLACVVALPFVGWLYWERLRQGSGEWLDSLGKTWPGKELIDVQKSMEAVLPWAKALFGDGFDRNSELAVLLLVAGGIVLWLWRHAFGPLWHFWDRLFIDDALSGTRAIGSKEFALSVPLMALLGILPLVLAAVVLNGLAIEGALLDALGWTIVAIAVGGASVLVIVGIVLLIRDRERLLRKTAALLDRATDPRQKWEWFFWLLLMILVVGWSIAAPRKLDGLAPVKDGLLAFLGFTPVLVQACAVVLCVRLARLVRLRLRSRWARAAILAAAVLPTLAPAWLWARGGSGLLAGGAAILVLLWVCGLYACVTRTSPPPADDQK